MLPLEAESKAKTSYLDTFKTTGNKHHLSITITLRIVSSYLPLVLKTAGIISVTQQMVINGFLQVWNLIIVVIAAYLVDRLADAFSSSALASACSSATSSLPASVVPLLQRETQLQALRSCRCCSSTNIASTSLIISYTSEIWLHMIRARGLAVVNMSTRFVVFGIFVNPIALESITGSTA